MGVLIEKGSQILAGGNLDGTASAAAAATALGAALLGLGRRRRPEGGVHEPQPPNPRRRILRRREKPQG